MSWISLEEEMPANGEVCIICIKKEEGYTGPRCGEWNAEKQAFYRVDGFFPGILLATHWIPVPKHEAA